jgi:hypothetical protein
MYMVAMGPSVERQRKCRHVSPVGDGSYPTDTNRLSLDITASTCGDSTFRHSGVRRGLALGGRDDTLEASETDDPG